MASVFPRQDPTRTAATDLQQAVFEVLEGEDRRRLVCRIVDGLIVFLICLSVTAVILESMQAMQSRFAPWFHWVEIVTVVVFTVEYALRVWCSVCAAQPADSPSTPGVRRLRYALSFQALIDLAAILPSYLFALGLLGGADMRFLRAIRLLRVLKLARYSPALNLLYETVAENGRALGAASFILVTVMLLASSGIYFFERTAQPVDFGSIPAAMWWAFATLTTVGYGDVTPVTSGGKVFGALITVVGVGMVALPTGIIATGFAHEVKTRKARFRTEADEALDDGELTELELSHLKSLRLELGLSEHTASQILDSRAVQRALHAASADRCPHCGAPREASE